MQSLVVENALPRVGCGQSSITWNSRGGGGRITPPRRASNMLSLSLETPTPGADDDDSVLVPADQLIMANCQKPLRKIPHS